MTKLVGPVGPEIEVAPGAGFPNATMLASGNYVVTWLDMVGPTNETLVAVFGGDGTQIGTTYTMSAATGYHDIAPLASGGFVAVYTTTGQAIAQIFDANGAPVGSTFPLGSIDYYSNSSFDVAGLANGGFAASFRNGTAVTVKTYNAGGTPIATISADIGDGGSAPEISELADGTLALVWHEYDRDSPYVGGYPDGYQVSAQLFDASGDALSPRFTVNQSQTGDHGGPQIVALAAGGFVVTWVHQGDDGGIWSQVYDETGTAVGSNILVSDGTPGWQAQPCIAALPWGGFLISWLDSSQGDSEDFGSGIRAQLFDDQGVPIGEPFQVNAQLYADEVTPSVLIISDTEAKIFYRADGNADPSGLLARAITLPVVGTQSQDVLNGGASGEAYAGLAGDDQLHGNGGDDALDGGLGADLLDGGAGSDWLYGYLGDDIIDGGSGVDHVNGGEGNDLYLVNAAGDHAAAEIGDKGLTGTDEVRFASAAPSTLTLYAGDTGIERVVIGTGTGAVADSSPTTALNVNAAAVGNALTMIGNAGANKLTGTAFDDTLNGAAGDDYLYGGFGNDSLTGGVGIDRMYGGVGDDTFYVTDATDHIYENAAEGTDEVVASVDHQLRANIESLTLVGSAIVGEGNDLDNVITGNANDNILYGDAGNDKLTGGAGYDKMYGGTGNDRYYVNDATDFAYEYAGEGIDRVTASIDYQLRANVENLNLVGSAVVGKGNELGNQIDGSEGANKLYGYAGDDQLYGNGGDDYLSGGEGNDILAGDAGYDKMYGGTGDDMYSVNDATDFAYENVGEGYDKVFASLSHTLRANIEELELSGSADIRGYGNAENNLITGNSGANLLYGRDGHDTLRGNDGNDLLYGENGNDRLDGGAGQDRYYGGAGADQFIFDDGDFAVPTPDRIMDFSQLEGDLIDLGAVDANTLLAGDQGFSFLGSNAFTGTAGELRTFQASGTTYLQGDTNGDGTGDFLIRIDGLHTLQASDFIM